MSFIMDFICVDVETTGLSAEKERIIEIGAVKYRNGEPIEHFSEFVRQELPVPQHIIELTGITQAEIDNAPYETEQMERFLAFAAEDQVILGHNLGFDHSFLSMAAFRLNRDFRKMGIDTLKIAKQCCSEMPERKLSAMCERYGVVNESAHRAYYDAKATAEVYFGLLKEFGASRPEVFKPVEMCYKPRKTEPATEKQVKYLRSLLRYHGISADINYETLTKSEASRRIDNIIANFGKPVY